MKRLLLVALVLMMLAGCRESEVDPATVAPRDNFYKNTARRKVGIREIQEDWSFDFRQFHAETWHVDGQRRKRVQRDENGGILYEYDYYDTGHMLPSPDDNDSELPESLEIVYDYRNETVLINCNTDDSDILLLMEPLYVAQMSLVRGGTYEGHTAKSNEAVFAVADKVLAKWDMVRLNPPKVEEE